MRGHYHSAQKNPPHLTPQKKVFQLTHTSTMKTIIVDDEQTSIATLSRLLIEHDDIELIGTASNHDVTTSLIKAAQPDLLFLDVELPDMSGIDFLEEVNQLTQSRCRVVMYTGHKESILPAFRHQAFDFLLKPIDRNELNGIINRLRHSEAPCTPHQPTDSGMQKKDHDKIMFTTGTNDLRLVAISDIGLFRYNSDERIWEVIVSGIDNPIRLRRNINNEALLSLAPCFAQVSQRFIINIDCLMEMSDNKCRLFPPFDTIDDIKVGRLFRKKLIERFSCL